MLKVWFLVYGTTEFWVEPANLISWRMSSNLNGLLGGRSKPFQTEKSERERFGRVHFVPASPFYSLCFPVTTGCTAMFYHILLPRMPSIFSGPEQWGQQSWPETSKLWAKIKSTTLPLSLQYFVTVIEGWLTKHITETSRPNILPLIARGGRKKDNVHGILFIVVTHPIPDGNFISSYLRNAGIFCTDAHARSSLQIVSFAGWWNWVCKQLEPRVLDAIYFHLYAGWKTTNNIDPMDSRTQTLFLPNSWFTSDFLQHRCSGDPGLLRGLEDLTRNFCFIIQSFKANC